MFAAYDLAAQLLRAASINKYSKMIFTVKYCIFTPMHAQFWRNSLSHLTAKSAAFFVIFLFFPLFFATENASSVSHCNIDDTDRFAWSENVGWIDFKPDPVNCVTVENTKLIGYAWSDFAGWISLNCENDGSCGAQPYGVVNDNNGNLSGLAWSEALGWIDFAPPPGPERVVIDASGEFTGYAWGDNFGWISFNCRQPADQGGADTCQPIGVDYKVKTTWLPQKPPNKPANVAPDDGTPPIDAAVLPTATGVIPLLQASAFSDPNPASTHQETEWQLSTDPAQDGTTGDFTNTPITITDPDVTKTEHQISAGVLQYGTRYYWHVQYQDNTGLWSLWSDPWSFTTPLSQPQNIVCSGSTSAYTVICAWDAVPNATGYEVYLKESDAAFWGVGAPTAPSFIVTNHHVFFGALPLASNDSYIIEVKATRADGSYADSELSNPSAPAFLGVQCPNNGRECRIGEACFDHDKDGGAATQMICTNFDNCAAQGAAPALETCYISACPSGIAQPDGSCYNASPAERIFHDPDSTGVCANKASVYQCDLLPAKPKNPEACKSDGSGCQSGVNLTGVPYQPRLKWKNGDPAESFNDYRGIALSYPGDDMQYTVIIQETMPSLPQIIYTPLNSVDLGLGSGVDRFLNFNNLISGPPFLDFNAAYAWDLRVQNSAGTIQQSSPVWTFTTESICPYINHDYAPPMYTDESLYPSPGNTPDNPNVMYPLDVTVKWDFDPTLPVGAVEGPGTGDKPKFVLYVQESIDGGTIWDPFIGPLGTVSTCGSWGCIDVGTDTQFRFGGSSDNCVDDPATCLEPDKQYRWYLEVIHGHNPSSPITTQCDNDNGAHNLDKHYFLSETTPGIALSKKLLSIRGAELTYQIDFSFTGAPWGRIKNVQIRDNYPNEAATDFFDTENPSFTDDVLTVKEPGTLKITRLCRASSGDRDTALIWGIGDSADPNCASVDPDCTVPTSCSASTNSHGSLILVMNEQTAEPVPQCTVLGNQATAKGEALSGEIVTAISNTVSHLGGSDQTDLGFLVTQRGDIHSNADICFKNAPLTGYYVGDYFVTAKGIVQSADPRAGGQYVISDDPILELDRNPSASDFAKIDYSEVYKLAKDDLKEYKGECSATQLFGDESVNPVIALNGKVYSCRAESTGATDYNNDGVTINGDFVVDREMEIDKDGKDGTIVVDGNLYIEADIFYEPGPPLAVKDVASLGWIVRGNIYIKGYRIDEVTDCTDPSSDPRPLKWCGAYQALEFIDNGPDTIFGTPDDTYALKYPAITLGPNAIAGTFFSEQKIFTGKINNPLTIDGSLIADEVVLERRVVDDGGG